MSENGKKRIYVPTIIGEIKDQAAHGSYMLPWPGIQCNFYVEPEDITVDSDVQVADVGPMAQQLVEFLKSDEPLMPFLAPYMPGVNYLTRYGAEQVWAVMPGWGKTRSIPRSRDVEFADATGALIDRSTGLPVIVKKPPRN